MTCDNGASKDVEVLSLADWIKRGDSLFGPVMAEWKFVCPQCGEIQTAREMVDRGGLSDCMAAAEISFGCIGRHVPGVGCGYSFATAPEVLETYQVVMPESGLHRPSFEFADA